MSSEMCVTKIEESHKNQHNPHHFCHTKYERPYVYIPIQAAALYFSIPIHVIIYTIIPLHLKTRPTTRDTMRCRRNNLLSLHMYAITPTVCAYKL